MDTRVRKCVYVLVQVNRQEPRTWKLEKLGSRTGMPRSRATQRQGWRVVDFYVAFEDGRDTDDEWSDVNGPPFWVALVVIAVAAVALACHIPATRTANWVGYIAGAWLVPVLAIVFYAADRKRARSRNYIPANMWNRIVNLSALSAIAIGFLHAYFASQSSYYG